MDVLKQLCALLVAQVMQFFITVQSAGLPRVLGLILLLEFEFALRVADVDLYVGQLVLLV